MGSAALGHIDLLNQSGASVTATNAESTMPAENLAVTQIDGASFRATGHGPHERDRR
ncbi:MAG: hypothetical protein AAF968_04675 [Pseudomonadota bacterium]